MLPLMMSKRSHRLIKLLIMVFKFQQRESVYKDFIFRLVLYSREDVSFNSICLNVLEDIKQFYLLMWFNKKPTRNTV